MERRLANRPVSLASPRGIRPKSTVLAPLRIEAGASGRAGGKWAPQARENEGAANYFMAHGGPFSAKLPGRGPRAPYRPKDIPAMSWMTLSDIEIAHMESAIREMDAGSDRSSALVAAAFVEQNLEIALQCRLKRDDAINKEMFRVSGPLGTFSGKIHMGFMIGLYEKAAWSELDLIRKIRNEFAHKLDCVDFASSDRVTSWISYRSQI